MSEASPDETCASSPTAAERKRTDSESGVASSPEIHFEPLVQLPLVQINTMEEEEEELVKIRAKLYRFDTSESPPEFKERGTGDVKLLKHRQTGHIRVLMRREKTLKLCANHYVRPNMELKKHNNSDKVFVWNTLADYVDEEPKQETLAIRFGSIENAQKFKDAFELAKKEMKALFQGKREDDVGEITNKLKNVNVEDQNGKKPESGEKTERKDQSSDNEKDDDEKDEGGE